MPASTATSTAIASASMTTRPHDGDARTAGLRELDELAAGLSPLPGLSGAAYATGHAAFEARSTQRAMLTSWLRDHLSRRTGDMSVLSVGCGDGTVDAALATTLAADTGRVVRYGGLDPHAASAGRFLAAVGVVGGVEVSAAVGRAEELPDGPAYDVVICLHSIYYVKDLGRTVRALVERLAPGGEVIIGVAPRGDLNVLAATLAPEVDGSRQWWAEDLAEQLVVAELQAERVSLHGRLHLDDCLDPCDPTGREVLDFAVQAVLPDSLRLPVLDHLISLRLPGPGLVLDHPVDVVVVPGR